MSTVTDGINTAMAVLSAGVAVLTLVDHRRARSGVARVSASRPSARPGAAGGEAAPAPVRRARRRSGKASAALVLGPWGLIVVLANRPGVQGQHHADFVTGVVLSLAGALLGVWAMVDIRLSPGMRGRWLAITGLAGALAGLVVALSTLH